MNLSQLRHLLALTQTGSFSRAAEQLHVTQSALSRSISALEEELGLKLVDRIGKSNELTPFGLSVVERARRIVQEAGELQRSAELYQTGQGGPLRLGLGATPSAVLMAPLLVHLVREHPRLKVWLSSGSIPMQLQALRMRNLDGLVVDWLALPQDQDLQIERLPAMRSGFLCRPGHPLHGRRRIGLADLSRYPIATTPLNQETIRQMVQSLGDKAHPEHFITIQCEYIPSLLEAICATDALFMGVLAGARALLEAGRLVELPTQPPLQVDGCYALVTLAGRTETPALGIVRALIAECMRSDWHSARAH